LVTFPKGEIIKPFQARSSKKGFRGKTKKIARGKEKSLRGGVGDAIRSTRSSILWGRAIATLRKA